MRRMTPRGRKRIEGDIITWNETRKMEVELEW
jgi:hypothetical protein